ncbi:MAG: DUF4249 family protein [Ignavibacteriales bacterium]|nr:DUF4249 family protein [Ignavibacteriales bacterium]
MKKSLLLIILGLVVLIGGCEENFNPIGEYRKEYTMNCLLAENKSVQYLTITQTYPVNEDGSAMVPKDNFVRDAVIRMWVEDSVYFFRDTIVARSTQVSGRSDSISYYYLPGFTPQRGKSYEIDAVFTYGSRMNSTINMPRGVTIQMLPVPRTLPVKYQDSWSFSWTSDEAGQLFVPSLKLEYYVKQNGSWNIHYKNMPTAIVKSNGKDEYVYALPSKNGSVVMQKAALDKLMNDIRAETVEAKDIYIERVILEVLVCDKNLSSFYLSTVMKADDFSINLEALDFDNINGGLGLYGGYTYQKSGFLFEWDYLQQFGFAYQIL